MKRGWRNVRIGKGAYTARLVHNMALSPTLRRSRYMGREVKREWRSAVFQT